VKVKASKYAALLLVFGTSFLFLPQAQANMGLQAYFYNNQTADNQYNNAPPIPPTTPLAFSIPVATVDQDFDLYPMSGLYEDFVVKYEGYITATESGTANLQCLADDGCIVIIDGVTIIDEWYDKGTSGDVYPYQMVPNQSLSFTVWYYENGGGAVIQLRWQLEGRDWAVVPESVFSPAPKIITIVESPSETHTVVAEETATVPSTSDSQTVVVDSPTATVSDTSVATVETPTSLETLTPVESTTPVVETGTAPVETLPLPTPPPIVEPEPILVPTPVVVEPQPIPPVEPEPEPSEPETSEPEPSEPEIDEEVPQEPEVENPDTEEPVVEEPEPDEEPSEYPEEEDTNEFPSDPEIQEPNEPTPDPVVEPVVEPQPVPQPDVSPEPPSVNSVDLESLAPDTPVTLENGVVITAEVAIAVALLQDPAELFTELFTDPAAALAALGSVGADMTPEEREESEKVVVSAIIAGGIATQSAAAAAAAAAYRRNP